MEQKSSERIINKLDQDVINKICAGEIIHRPLNVVKELIENSLDAGATMITVTVKNGGLKQITIQDNGCGITKEDLKIVCDRFTTSKLKNFEDFNSLKTFGFRGEALSSVSIVAQVSIISKTANSICAYKAEYADGHIKDNSIIPIAANDGTTIVVDNLFHNMPTRKTALSSEAQELNLIHEVLFKYSLIFSGKCGFILKKHNENSHVINTNVNNTLLQNIDRLFSQNISSHLIPIDIKNEKLDFKINGYFSNNDLNMKKFNLILSINSRLVECASLKKSLKDFYKDFLMKGGNPFVILFIEIHPKNIDVNIHPNKKEVCFLYDNEIIYSITNFIQSKLTNKPQYDIILNKHLDLPFEMSKDSNSCNFTVKSEIPSQEKQPNHFESNSLQQTTISSFIAPFSKATPQNNDEVGQKQIERISSPLPSSSQKKTPLRPSKNCRVDYKLQRLDQYLNQAYASLSPSRKHRRSLELTSLDNLRQELGQNIDQTLLNMLSESSYVGCIDENFLLIQHKLNLFMLRIENFNRELFYQLFLLDFGNFDYIRFKESLSIRSLLSTYLEVNLPIEELETCSEKITNMTHLLISKQEMLDDYFSIKINKENETIEALPILIKNHQPNFCYIPEFVFCLCTKVNWTKEKECFYSLGQQLAQFYSRSPNITNEHDHQSWSNLMENNIYPLYKSLLLPSINLQERSFYLVTNVTNLYKVFERC